MADITVLLNCWRRPGSFAAAVQALRAQTVAIDRLVVFRNHYDGPDLDAAHRERLAARWTEALQEQPGGYQLEAQPENLGVWARFCRARDFQTPLVCIFDDDTIPGPRWLENCCRCFEQREGVYGAVGIRFAPGRGRYRPSRYGWARPTDETQEVDIAGHCWFFPRSYLDDFVAQMPNFPCLPTCGEDYHLSYVAQQRGRPTCCPPHPPGDRELWGSLNPRTGQDGVALYKQPGEESKKRQSHNAYRAAGWRLVRETNPCL